jgi:hypothetical protein
MKLSEIRPEAYLNEQKFRLISYSLIALMMGCVTLTVGELLGRVLPAWPQWPVAFLGILISADRLYRFGQTRKLTLFSTEWLATFGAQWVVIILALRLVIGLAQGPGALLAELPNWPGSPLEHFFTVEFIAGLLLTVTIWVITGSFAELLDEFGLQQALIAQDVGIAANGEAPARDRLVSLVFTVCTGLVFIAAILRVNLRAIQGDTSAALFFDLPPLAGGGASTLAYFMLGLALLSLTQFMALHTRWSLERIPVSAQLAGRWALYSLVFLGLVAGLASLLPTRYSLGLLSLLNLIITVVAYIIQIFIMLVFFLISLPFMLLGRQAPLQNAPIAPPSLPEALQTAATTSATAPWVESLKALLFWGGLLAIILYSVVLFLRQHQEILSALRKMPGWRFLAQFFRWLAGLWRGAQKGVTHLIAAGRERLRSQRANRALFSTGFLNLRRLDPRQKVYFFYLAFIRRSGESGLPRRLAQTPTEFAAAVEHSLPEAETDIDALTAAFIEARYSRRPVEPEKANLVRDTWERVRKVLRGNKKEASGK